MCLLLAQWTLQHTLWDGTEGGAKRINRFISAVEVVSAQTSEAN